MLSKLPGSAYKKKLGAVFLWILVLFLGIPCLTMSYLMPPRSDNKRVAQKQPKPSGTVPRMNFTPTFRAWRQWRLEEPRMGFSTLEARSNKSVA